MLYFSCKERLVSLPNKLKRLGIHYINSIKNYHFDPQIQLKIL